MSVFAKIKGIIGNLFLLGTSATAHGIADETNGIKVVANDGTTPANATIARPTVDTHATTYLDLKQRAILIEYAITDAGGGVPTPAPGTNTGKYGLCPTSFGAYAAGSIYYDNGVSYDTVPLYKMMVCTPTLTFAGTVSMSMNDTYIASTAVAPWGWTRIGGEAHEAGEEMAIKVPFTFASMGGNVDSTATMPDGATVVRSSLVVTTPFTGGAGPTALVVTTGAAPQTLQATSDNNLGIAAQYDVLDCLLLAATAGGKVRVTLAGTAGVGVGYVLVQYITAST